MCVGGAHRFDFAGPWLELLQCTEAKKVVALPQCIEADLQLLQSRPIQLEHLAWRRVGGHVCKMSGQQCLHSIIPKVARLDDGHRSENSAASAESGERAKE
jgi:hypothetical protein